MDVTRSKLEGVFRLRPKVFRDERGFFLEAWNKQEFDRLVGRHVDFVQDNFSHSTRGVLRGLHYQTAPKAQGKLIRVLSGKIFDVAVDVREGSRTRGAWTGLIMDAADNEAIWIPEGFAHGFLVLSDCADVFYKATDYYSPEHERGVRWDDPAIGIEWPLEPGIAPVLSPRDAAAPAL